MRLIQNIMIANCPLLDGSTAEFSKEIFDRFHHFTTFNA